MTSRELTSGFDFWSRGHMRMAVMHLPVKFGAYIFIQCGVFDILPKLKMAAAAILDLLGEPWDHPQRHTGGAYSLCCRETSTCLFRPGDFICFMSSYVLSYDIMNEYFANSPKVTRGRLKRHLSRANVSPCLYFIVTMCLSRIVSEMFSVK